MKFILRSKFEGGILNSEGYGGGSYRVNIKTYYISPREKKEIEIEIDKFDHTLTVGEELFSKEIENNSRRVIVVNKEVSERVLTQCIYNLIYKIIGDNLIEIELDDSLKLGYICDAFTEGLKVSFEYLKD